MELMRKSSTAIVYMVQFSDTSSGPSRRFATAIANVQWKTCKKSVLRVSKVQTPKNAIISTKTLMLLAVSKRREYSTLP